MVECKYVFIRRTAEALCSEEALVAGIKRTNLMRRVSWDKNEGCELAFISNCSFKISIR